MTVVGIHIEVSLLLLIAAMLVGALVVEASVDVGVDSVDIVTLGRLVLAAMLEVDS